MKSLVLLLALVLVASCGDGKFSSPQGSITGAQAAAFFQLTGNTSPKEAVQPNTHAKPDDSSFGLTREGTEAECTTQDPESPVDADSDGIKLTKKVTWNCTNVADTRDGTFTRNGTMTETDKDDTVAYGGYKFEYDVKGSSQYSGGSSNYEYAGYWEMTKSGRNGAEVAGMASPNAVRATSWNYKTDWEGTYTYGGHPSAAWGHTFDFTMTENAAARDFQGSRVESGDGTGTVEFEGYYAWTGTIDEDDDRAGQQVNVTFRVKSTGLTFKRTGCANFYNGGQIQWTDGAGNIMLWIYDSCTVSRVLYNGSQVSSRNIEG